MKTTLVLLLLLGSSLVALAGGGENSQVAPALTAPAALIKTAGTGMQTRNLAGTVRIYLFPDGSVRVKPDAVPLEATLVAAR